MNKKLNITSITSELEGSAFFPSKRIPTPLPEKAAPQGQQTASQPSDRTADRSTDRPTGKQVLIRRGFEWYEYQLSALKKLSLEEQIENKGDGSMSRMVREALDEYLAKKGVIKK